MPLKTYSGTGTTLSAAYYLRRFYSANTDARTETSRSHLGSSTLSSADALALRKAVKALGSFTYDDDHDDNIRNSVAAFVSTYNHMLDSAAESGDRTLQKTAKSLKNLTDTYADELDKIGITVNSDGTLETRSSLFPSADISKFEELFSSDSEYMQRVSSYTRRLESRSSDLVQIEKNQKLLREKEKNQTSTTAAAEIVANRIDLDTLANTGIGSHINISL